MRPDLPPSLLAARRDAERLEWIGRLPTLWEPDPADLPDAWVTLAVLGTLWAGDLATVETAWSGTALHGGIGLLDAIRSWPCGRNGKGGITIGTGHHNGITLGLRRAGADLWSGQVDAEKIWRSCAAAIEPAGSIDQEATGVSATGYDWRGVNDPARDGFAVADHTHIRIVRYPAVELLALLGAEWLVRHNAWRRWAVYVYLPTILDRPFRDPTDAAEALRGCTSWTPYQLRMVGKRRYILPIGAPSYGIEPPPEEMPPPSGSDTLRRLVDRSGLSTREAARILDIDSRDLRRMLSGETWVWPDDPVIGRASMLLPRRVMP